MEQPKLSVQARRTFEDRLRELEDERLPRLERELAESGDPVIAAALKASRDEASTLRGALARATPLEDEPHDPTVVELGDTVTVRQEGSSERERFTLVGDLESRLAETWISVKSPLGSALMGSRLGRMVEVKTPVGPQAYEVLGIERRELHPSDD